MADTSSNLPDLKDMLGEQPESTDPAYLNWRDEKVRKAIAKSDTDPGSTKSLRDVCDEFDIEY